MPAQAQDILFEEEQSFRQPWMWAIITGVLLLQVGVVLVVVPMLLFHVGPPVKPGSDVGTGIVALTAGLAVVIAAAVLMYFLKLSVRVDDAGLHVRFFPLLKREIALAQIARWEARTYRPLLEYGGWGIRCSWKGMAYNVSGNRGVQLEFTNGKRLLIGSQRPEELAAAITQAKEQGTV